MSHREDTHWLAFGVCSLLAVSAAGQTAQPESTAAGTEQVDELLQLSLEDLLAIVVTASKVEQRPEDSPAVVSVITREEIQRHGYQTVGEALGQVPGLASINDYMSFNLGVRGFYSSIESSSDLVKLMINGQPVAFRATGENFFGYELIPIQTVKRIEVVRGPASALYGANAFLGVINIITYDGDESLPEGVHHHNEVEFHPFYTSKNRQLNGGVSAMTRGSAFGISYLAGANYTYANRSGLAVPGLTDMQMAQRRAEDPSQPAALGYPTPGVGGTSRSLILADPISANDAENVGGGYASASYALSENQRIRVDGTLQYFDRGSEFNSISYLTHLSRMSILNGYARARYDLTPTNRGVFLSLAAAFTGGTTTPKDLLRDRSAADFFTRRYISYRGFDLLAEGGFAFDDRTRLTLGVDYKWELQSLLRLDVIDAISGISTVLDKGRGNKVFGNTGVYAQALWGPLTSLNIAVGARADHNSAIACDYTVFGCFGKREDSIEQGNGDTQVTVTNRGFMQLSSRAAVVYTAPVAGLYAKALYGSSFKPPSPFQLYHSLVYVGGTEGYPFLKPQTGHTFEAQVGHASKTLKAQLNFFYTLAQGLVLFLPEIGRIQPRNANATSSGAEAAITYPLSKRVTTSANATLLFSNSLQPQQRTSETEALWKSSKYNVTIDKSVYPNIMANLFVFVDIPEAHLRVDLGGHFVGTRYASIYNAAVFDSVNLKKSYPFAPYVNVDITVSTQGLKFFGQRETVIAFTARNIPGNNDEPGNFGIDIPNIGPKLLLSLMQEF